MAVFKGMRKIKASDAILTVVDIQTRLVPAMHDAPRLTENARKLIQACRLLELPILFTQQYTKGLGMTIDPIIEAAKPVEQPAADEVAALLEKSLRADSLTEFSFIEKTSFSMMGDTDCVKALKDSGCRSVILCGIEAHVCVLQSALDLLDSGFDVFVIEDAVDSRQPADKSSAISRMSDAKAVVTTTEAILFELIGGARHPMFKEISKLVK